MGKYESKVKTYVLKDSEVEAFPIGKYILSEDFIKPDWISFIGKGKEGWVVVTDTMDTLFPKDGDFIIKVKDGVYKESSSYDFYCKYTQKYKDVTIFGRPHSDMGDKLVVGYIIGNNVNEDNNGILYIVDGLPKREIGIQDKNIYQEIDPAMSIDDELSWLEENRKYKFIFTNKKSLKCIIKILNHLYEGMK